MGGMVHLCYNERAFAYERVLPGNIAVSFLWKQSCAPARKALLPERTMPAEPCVLLLLLLTGTSRGRPNVFRPRKQCRRRNPCNLTTADGGYVPADTLRHQTTMHACRLCRRRNPRKKSPRLNPSWLKWPGFKKGSEGNPGSLVVFYCF